MWDNKKTAKAMRLISQGYPAKMIAEKLEINPATFYSWAWRNKIDYNRNKNYIKSLKPKIKDLIELKLAGHTDAQIAKKLGISRQAVNQMCDRYFIEAEDK